jgi:hypothetical protein
VDGKRHEQQPASEPAVLERSDGKSQSACALLIVKACSGRITRHGKEYFQAFSVIRTLL